MKFEKPLPDVPDVMDKPPASVPNAQQRSTSIPLSSHFPSTHFPRAVHVDRLSTQPASPAFSTPARNPRVHLVDLFHSPLGVFSPVASAPPPAPKPAPARAPLSREESDSGSSDVVITGMQLQNRRHRSRERRTRDLRRAQAQIGRSPSGSREREQQ